MIQENRVLAGSILVKYPRINKFTQPNSQNKGDERFAQCFEGIFEGLNFVTRNPETLNELLETVEERLLKFGKGTTISGLITSDNQVVSYTIGDMSINISSILKKEKDNDPLKLLITPSVDHFGETLITTYGEVPANADQYANGLCTKNKGGATFITLDRNGNIIDFDQLLDKDKREPIIIAGSTHREMTKDEKDAEFEARKDEIDDVISIVSGWNN